LHFDGSARRAESRRGATADARQCKPICNINHIHITRKRNMNENTFPHCGEDQEMLNICKIKTKWQRTQICDKIGGVANAVSLLSRSLQMKKFVALFAMCIISLCCFAQLSQIQGQTNGNHWVSAWTSSLFLSTPLPGFPAETPITDKTVRVVARSMRSSISTRQSAIPNILQESVRNMNRAIIFIRMPRAIRQWRI
jgi:hypothetical protein